MNSCSSQYSTALRVIVKEATTHLMEDNNTAYIINFINNIHRMSYTAGNNRGSGGLDEEVVEFGMKPNT